MCPDKELISAFFDEETDAQWSNKISEHIDSCSDCNEQYRKIERLNKYLLSADISEEQIIKTRVYDAIKRKQIVSQENAFWRRHIELSFSVLASAAVLIIALCIVFITGYSKAMEIVSSENTIEEIPQDINVQIIKLDEAAAYILSEDTGYDILITIPSGSGLNVKGRPELIREADYNRRQ
ncbi:MAG: hypothetical protein PQJ46_11170 [Spirochaetales bacterium]|nr:hypothetical protein [Spirochaetales bacterium]